MEVFDPAPETAEKPSLMASLFGGGGGGTSSRAARVERLTEELVERVDKGSDIWVVAEDDVPLGTADLSEQEMLLPTHSVAEGLYLSSMAVDAGARRSGIGRTLLRMAEERAAERSAPGIYLHVERSNAAAIALYEGNGFRKQPSSPYYDSFSAALDLRYVEPLLYYKPLDVRPATAAETEASAGRAGVPVMRLNACTHASGSRARGIHMMAKKSKKKSDTKSFGMAAPPPAAPPASSDDGGQIGMATQLLAAGLGVDQIRSMLIAEGVAPEEAERLIEEANATPQRAAPPSAPATSPAAPAPASDDNEPAVATPSEASNPIATFTTSLGVIQCEIFVDAAPLTASNFIDLAQSGFYDGLHFHRVIPLFMDQFGCPNSRDPSSALAGTGGPDAGSTFTNLADGSTCTRLAGGNIEDEFTSRITNDAGTLAMANSGQANSGGSQMFMNVNDNAELDWFSPGSSKHPVFGKAIDEASFNVMVAISQVATQNDRPVTPVRVESISIDAPAEAIAASPASPPAPRATAPAAEVFANMKSPVLIDDSADLAAAAPDAASDVAPPEGRAAADDDVDEAALFDQAVESARASLRQAEEERAIARPAFKTEEEIIEERQRWTQAPLQNYIDAMVDPSQTLDVPETSAERAAAEARRIKEQALKEQAQEQLPGQAAPTSGPAAFLGMALQGAKNIQQAMGAALKESNEKQKAAAAAERAAPRKPRGNLRKLYQQLDAAIDADDLERAGAIKRQIDELK